MVPSSTFASSAGDGDDKGIATIEMADTVMTVPDGGLTLPGASLQAGAEELGMYLTVDTREAAAAAEEAKRSLPDPVSAKAPGRVERLSTAVALPSRDKDRAEPAEQAAASTAPPADAEPTAEVAEVPATEKAERASAGRAARAGTRSIDLFVAPEPEKAAPSRTTDVAIDTLAPQSAAADWDLMPEMGVAAIPLVVAAALVIAYGAAKPRRATPRHATVAARRRHAAI